MWMDEERGTDGVVEHNAFLKWSLEKTSVGEKGVAAFFMDYIYSLMAVFMILFSISGGVCIAATVGM